MEEIVKYLVIAALGALASVLSNRGIAVFNDGLRPVIPEYLEGRMDRKALAATSFAISFGLIVGFALPTSIAASIILLHCVLLGTDIIGTFCPAGLKGSLASAALGALYGVGLLVGLQSIIDLFARLPVNFLPELGQVATPIVVSFAVFPAVAVGLQFGFKKGLLTGLVALVVRELTQRYGVFVFDGVQIALNREGMALLAGMAIMIFFAVRDKTGVGDANTQLAQIFAEKVARIRTSIAPLACMGGLIAAATSLSLVAGDPISLNLLAEGNRSSAAMTAFARAIGFIPLIATTAIATGVYAPAGMTFVFVIGLSTTNPLLAFVMGALCLGAEVFLLNYAAGFLDHFPGVRRCSDNIRTAMGRVLNVALLVGGIMSAQAMAPGFGIFVVVGMYCLNKTSKKPIVDMAIGPVGAILTGILVNIIALLQ
ncbi:YhfT family protein [Desulfovibrio sp. OttesenSCG-928-G15]|nr:YhfT family protein [Desulfovibrio sp. OttesenSCG-928-G15]